MKLHGFEYTRTSDGSKPDGHGWEVCDELTGAGKTHTFWRRLVKR